MSWGTTRLCGTAGLHSKCPRFTGTKSCLNNARWHLSSATIQKCGMQRWMPWHPPLEHWIMMIIFVVDSYQTWGTQQSIRICFIASNQLHYNHDSPASKKPCLMPSFEHTDVAISGRNNKNSINAFFFDVFKLKNSNMSE